MRFIRFILRLVIPRNPKSGPVMDRRTTWEAIEKKDSEDVVLGCACDYTRLDYNSTVCVCMVIVWGAQEEEEKEPEGDEDEKMEDKEEEDGKEDDKDEEKEAKDEEMPAAADKPEDDEDS